METSAAVSATSEPNRLTEEVILLVGHGSRDEEGVAEFRELVRRVEGLSGPRPVKFCFLELAEPPVLQEIERCVNEGARRIKIVPFFLLAAGHVKTDVASAVNLARTRFPRVTFEYGAPIGIQPLILEILAEKLAQADKDHSSEIPLSETAVLLVERGSSDPDANSEVYKVARLLWEGREFGWVETAFIGITGPRVDQGIDRCVRLGARRVIVLPYFLFTGVLVKRIATIAGQKQQEYPAVEMICAEHIGVHAGLEQIFLNQLAQIETGQVRMSCDLCKYRVRLNGFEADFGAPQLSDHSHGLRGEHDHGHHHNHDHHSHDHEHEHDNHHDHHSHDHEQPAEEEAGR